MYRELMKEMEIVDKEIMNDLDEKILGKEYVKKAKKDFKETMYIFKLLGKMEELEEKFS